MTDSAANSLRHPGPPFAAKTNEVPFRVPSRLEIWSIAFAMGCAVCVGSLAVQWAIYNVWLGDPGQLRLLGPIVSGLLAAAFTERMMWQSRRRRLATLRRFQIIAEMNHHIRNSLQMISYERLSADEGAAVRLKEAVDRIQWVLEQVLPRVQDGNIDRPAGSGR